MLIIPGNYDLSICWFSKRTTADEFIMIRNRGKYFWAICWYLHQFEVPEITDERLCNGKRFFLKRYLTFCMHTILRCIIHFYFSQPVAVSIWTSCHNKYQISELGVVKTLLSLLLVVTQWQQFLNRFLKPHISKKHYILGWHIFQIIWYMPRPFF